MYVGVVIPVGPGHEHLVDAAIESVYEAGRPCRFSEWEAFTIDDPKGALGRSRARNVAAEAALREGCDWLFFLDADDTMVPEAGMRLEAALDARPGLQAVWGRILHEVGLFDSTKTLIATEQHSPHNDRTPLETWEELVSFDDPFGSFNVGCAIRCDLWREIGGFLEDWDIAEDHEFAYLAAATGEWIKLHDPLILVGAHRESAGGPRGGSVYPSQNHPYGRYKQRGEILYDWWKARGRVPLTEDEKARRSELYGV